MPASSDTPAPPPSSAIRTLGPVSDLERHLPADWWRTLFNAFYLKTDGDVVENREATRGEVDHLIAVTGLDADEALLDLCCGQGRHSLEFARRGYSRIVGVDRSRYLIRLARRRARAEGLPVEFREGDARKFRLKDRRFDVVALLGNSFGYFEQAEDDLAVLRNAAAHLVPDGRLLMDVVDGAWMRTHFEPRSWEWIDQEHFVCRERALARDGHRLVAREVIVHAEKGVLVDQFYAERLYSRDELAALLERAGFRAVTFHDPITTESTRGEDLGMLENRLLLTALAPARPKHRAPARTAPLFPDVTVLLGDPRLPDPVKVDGQFNAEDFATVDKMKAALSEVPGYTFRYVDDHATLMTALASEPPAFVLNLCDEGYRNDPFKELHVPALLEMLGIPYSGAGPACLGLCYDKGLVRALADALDIPTPMETFLGVDDAMATLPSAFPALVKPNFGDSSVGITRNAVVSSRDELLDYLTWLRERHGRQPVLVQEFLTGPEYSVGLIGNPGVGFRTLPVLEVDYSELGEGLPPILGYESKWLPDSPYWTRIHYRQARVEDDALRRLTDYAALLFERLGCRDYARFDFRADVEGRIKLLEVNPNPGWCWDGKLNLMAGFADLSYSDFLRLVLEAAQERYAPRPA